MESLNTQVVTETLHRLFCWIESQGKATPSSTFWGTTRKITDHKGQNNKLGKLWPPWKHTLSQLLKESFSLTPCCCKVLKQQPRSMLLEWVAKKTTGEWHRQNGKIGVFCGLPSPKNTNFDHHPWIVCPCGSPRATEKVPALPLEQTWNPRVDALKVKGTVSCSLHHPFSKVAQLSARVT